MMEWSQLLSERRMGQEEGREQKLQQVRSEFERDYDRIVFSPPFRRLQNKTQVFPLPGNIFVHNRLTHSLEVSCLGRSLGNIVAPVLRERHPKDELPFGSAISAIVSAACLAHDMGNPPFGHSGERAIGAYFREGNGRKWQAKVEAEGGRWEDFLYFEGNANAFRLLTHQFKGRRPGGFALTYSTVASIIKYPFPSTEASTNKFGYFQSEERTMQELAREVGLISHPTIAGSYARYPLVYLVEAADDICYQVMDIEDSYKLGILSRQEASDLLIGYLSPEVRDEATKVLQWVEDPNEQIGYLRSRAINVLVEEVAQIFLDSEDTILAGRFSGSLTKHLSPYTQQAYDNCTDIAYGRIYSAREAIDVELAGHRIFGQLLDNLLEALHQPDYVYSQAILRRVSSQYDTNQLTTYGKIQCALDYISGMTDIYALDLYRRITGMNLPAI